MFNMDPNMTLARALQEDRMRTFPRRRWTEGRTGRRPRRARED